MQRNKGKTQQKTRDSKVHIKILVSVNQGESNEAAKKILHENLVSNNLVHQKSVDFGANLSLLEFSGPNIELGSP